MKSYTGLGTSWPSSLSSLSTTWVRFFGLLKISTLKYSVKANKISHLLYCMSIHFLLNYADLPFSSGHSLTVLRQEIVIIILKIDKKNPIYTSQNNTHVNESGREVYVLRDWGLIQCFSIWLPEISIFLNSIWNNFGCFVMKCCLVLIHFWLACSLYLFWFQVRYKQLANEK